MTRRIVAALRSPAFWDGFQRGYLLAFLGALLCWAGILAGVAIAMLVLP